MKSMNRRTLLKGGSLAGLGFALSGTALLAEVGCGPNLQVQFAIARQIANAISQTLTNLNLPGPVALIAKVVAALNDIEKAYKSGQFQTALGFLNAIAAPGGLFDQILADINVASNKQIKGFMIALQGALSVIAVILEAQKHTPAVAGALAAIPSADLSTLVRLADESRIDNALKALRN